MKYLSYSRVAQLVEHGAVNSRVVGSSPIAGAIAENCVKAHEVVSKRKIVPTGAEQLTEYRN